MDFKSTIDLIIKDLNEASDIIDDLKKYQGVPALQVEFAKSKCKSAAEVIALLKNIEDILPEKNREQKAVAVKQEENVPEKLLPKPEIHEEIKREVTEAPAPVKAVEVKPEVVKPQARPASQAETKPEPKKATEKKKETSIAEKFAPASDLYEEKLNIKAEKDLSDKLKHRPLTNLSDAIGINDRFLFINEIFDGNKDAYSQAISRLDKAESLSDAMAIIMSYTGEKPENEAVIQLLDLVRLKLPADE
jgi:outer membrane biosynthesis protein TonB